MPVESGDRYAAYPEMRHDLSHPVGATGSRGSRGHPLSSLLMGVLFSANWAREKGAGLASAELLPGARIVRAFNAVGYARMGAAHEEPGRFGMPIASDDEEAVAIVSPLIRDIGYEPVLIGGLESGKHLMPGTPLAGERAPEDIRRIAATLD